MLSKIKQGWNEWWHGSFGIHVGALMLSFIITLVVTGIGDVLK